MKKQRKYHHRINKVKGNQNSEHDLNGLKSLGIISVIQ